MAQKLQVPSVQRCLGATFFRKRVPEGSCTGIRLADQNLDQSSRPQTCCSAFFCHIVRNLALISSVVLLSSCNSKFSNLFPEGTFSKGNVPPVSAEAKGLDGLKSATFLTFSPGGSPGRSRPPADSKVDSSKVHSIRYVNLPQGDVLLAASEDDGLVRSAPMSPKWRPLGPFGSVRPLQVSFNRRFDRAAGTAGQLVEVLAAGREPGEDGVLSDLTTRATSLEFHALDPVLYIGAADGVIYRWRYEGPWSGELGSTNRRLERYLGHGSTVSALWAHPGGKVFFSGDWRGHVFAWRDYAADPYAGEYDRSRLAGGAFADLADRSELPRVSDGSAIEAIQGDVNGDRVFVATAGGSLEVWSVRGLKSIATVAAHRGAIRLLAVRADGRQIATVGRDGWVRRWEVSESTPASATVRSTEEIKLVFETERRDIKAVAFTDAGNLCGITAVGAVVVF